MQQVVWAAGVPGGGEGARLDMGMNILSNCVKIWNSGAGGNTNILKRSGRV